MPAQGQAPSGSDNRSMQRIFCTRYRSLPNFEGDIEGMHPEKDAPFWIFVQALPGGRCHLPSS